MKKFFVTLAFCAATAVSVFAQGTVSFANNSSSLIINGATGTSATSGAGIFAALYYAVDGTSNFASFTQIGANKQVGLVPPGSGLVSGGTITTPNTTAAGGFAMFQIRAWNSQGGTYTSYESAVAGGAATGFSNIIRVQTGDGATIPTGSLTANGLTGFTVVPEPSTIALGVLGVGSLLFIRRRK